MTKPASKRQQAWRRRQACGIKLLQIPVVEFALVNALIESHRLSPSEAMDPAALTRATSEIIGEWARLWGEKP